MPPRVRPTRRPTRPGRRRRAEPERAGRQPEAERGEQADRAGAERPHGRQHRAQHEDRAGRQQRDRHAVVDGAEQPAQRVDGVQLAGLPAVPAAVDEEREEDRERDSAEADQVELALLELGQARGHAGARRGAPGASSSRRRPAGARRAGRASGSRRSFDAASASPPFGIAAMVLTAPAKVPRRGLNRANIRDRRSGLPSLGMDTAARPVRVLVVEDDEEIAQVLQRSLRMEGYEVKLAGDGVQALDEAHAFLPDLIVLDLGLPRLDGIDVASGCARTTTTRRSSC